MEWGLVFKIQFITMDIISVLYNIDRALYYY